MKIGIIKCSSDEFWYKNSIGEVFDIEVTPNHKSGTVINGVHKGKTINIKNVGDFQEIKEPCCCHGTGGKHHMLCPESPIEKARKVTSSDVDVCSECLLAYDIKEGHECDRAVHQGRTFTSKAYRDGDDGKLRYTRGLCPTVQTRYMEFLQRNREQSNGEMRDFDNWKKGIPASSYIESLGTHFWCVWEYFRSFKKPKLETGDIVDDLCAMRFNIDGLIHEILKARHRKSQRFLRELVTNSECKKAD